MMPQQAEACRVNRDQVLRPNSASMPLTSSTSRTSGVTPPAAAQAWTP